MRTMSGMRIAGVCLVLVACGGSSFQQGSGGAGDPLGAGMGDAGETDSGSSSASHDAASVALDAGPSLPPFSNGTAVYCQLPSGSVVGCDGSQILQCSGLQRASCAAALVDQIRFQSNATMQTQQGPKPALNTCQQGPGGWGIPLNDPTLAMDPGFHVCTAGAPCTVFVGTALNPGTCIDWPQ